MKMEPTTKTSGMDLLMAMFCTFSTITLFHVSDCQIYREAQSSAGHANFVKHPSSLLSAPFNILSVFENLTSLDCAFRCLETESCVSFNFGNHSKQCQLLSLDKYGAFAGSFGAAMEFDHYSIAVSLPYYTYHIPPYQEKSTTAACNL